jgi:S1-C subfamily serine protease
MLVTFWATPAGMLVAQGDGKPAGTGFVVHSDGFLLTAAHVIKDAARVEVVIGDKRHDANILAMDESRDLALLQIKAKSLPTLPLGDSNTVEVGEEVRVFGFPLAGALGDSVKVTRGTISGIETKGGEKIFQIDAAINPGNSGGPLVNDGSKVIGVIQAKLIGAIVSNVGFSVPINYAKLLLQNKGLGFGTQGAKSKLDGAMLVRRVIPAAALLMVTLQPIPALTPRFPPIVTPMPPAIPIPLETPGLPAMV